jgi:hypothetical protein
MLNTLSYEITVPTAEFFIQRFVAIARGNTEMMKLTCYFAERTIQEYSFIKYRPSSIAAAALCLAIKTLNCQPGSTCNYHWTQQLEKHTRYSEKVRRFLYYSYFGIQFSFCDAPPPPHIHYTPLCTLVNYALRSRHSSNRETLSDKPNSTKGRVQEVLVS